MKISTKGRYGLRAMVDLALYSKYGYTALNSIAERQEVSEKYLEHVFSVLKKAGLVKSVKGAQGGYILACNSAVISVGDILRVLEGKLSVIPDSEKENNATDPMEEFLNKNVWRKIDSKINSIVNSITLDDLVMEYKKMVETSSFIYHI
ncbi:MAG: Rrf2 family transcriptional regulator [Firmicutes bacterium]|nr:Rrf2 family transcriptional regulator [Bacillota bacterium]